MFLLTAYFILFIYLTFIYPGKQIKNKILIFKCSLIRARSSLRGSGRGVLKVKTRLYKLLRKLTCHCPNNCWHTANDTHMYDFMFYLAYGDSEHTGTLVVQLCVCLYVVLVVPAVSLIAHCHHGNTSRVRDNCLY